MKSQHDKRADILLVDFGAGDHGHRGPLNAMLARLFRLAHVDFSAKAVFDSRPMLVPMIEHSPFGFLLACLVRGLLGRRTVGLLFRPLPTLRETRLAMRVKRLLCLFLRRYPGVQVLTIVPFAVEPEMARIAHGWIHDPQEWDLQLDPSGLAELSLRVSRDVEAAAKGRLVCTAIGAQNHEKGFDRLARLYLDHGELRSRLHLAIGGTVASDQQEAARALAELGATCIDRYISDGEIFGLYHAADLVWCRYEPSYDQASGILGRAMQLGIPAVVRPGSVTAALCRISDHPCIELGADADWAKLLAMPPRVAPAQAAAGAQDKGRASLARLAEALGVAPAWNPFVA
jgi:hypothetical protein